MTPRAIFFLTVGLTIFGLIMIGSASVVAADRDFSDKWFYLRQQLVWSILGLVGLIITSRLPINLLQKYSTPILVSVVVLLVAVLIPPLGKSFLGARRWLDFGLFSFQPAELAKIAVAIYFARMYKHKTTFTPFALVTALLAGLIMLEPDMGTTIVVVGTSSLMYFGSGGPLKPLIYALPIALLVATLAIVVSPYRLERVKTFLNSSHDPQGSSYQVLQSVISLGSGGIFGSGLGQSRQKYEFLPEVTTDSIFAVVGEETGLIGTVSVVIAFALLALGGLEVASKKTDRFASLLALGISSWFGIQAFINMSAVVSLLPFTGIPLSFVSYGGTSLLITLISSGILINIAKK